MGERTPLGALLEFLGGTELMTSIQQMLADVPGIEDSTREHLSLTLSERVANIRQSLQDLVVEDDEMEAVTALPWLWLELRFEWMRYNAQMQYQTVFRGQADPGLMARGAALSCVLERVEQALTPEVAFFVAKLAADPMAVASAELTRNERVFDALAMAEGGSQRAFDALFKAQETILNLQADERVLASFDLATASVMEELQKCLQVNGKDFRLAVEQQLAALLPSSTVHVVLQAQFSDEVSMPCSVAVAFRRLVQGWLQALLPRVPSAEARLQAGRSAYLTLSFELRVQTHMAELILGDDAGVDCALPADTGDAPTRDLAVSIAEGPTGERQLVARATLRNVQEYLVVRAGPQTDDALIAIPIDAVERMETAEAEAVQIQGRALKLKSDDAVVQLVDLGERLYASGIRSEEAPVYVIVRLGEEVGNRSGGSGGGNGNGSEASRRAALRVRELHGFCRGPLRPLPVDAPRSYLRGLVLDRRRLVGVLDLEQLG